MDVSCIVDSISLGSVKEEKEGKEEEEEDDAVRADRGTCRRPGDIPAMFLGPLDLLVLSLQYN